MTDYEETYAAYYDYRATGLEGDVQFYVAEAQKAGSPVLELGCGTGRILIPVAQAGVAITGLDLSVPMLDIARRKVAGLDATTRGRIELAEGDMRRFALGRRFNLEGRKPRRDIHAKRLRLEDLERLRLELGVRRWMLFGGSWGSTLALAYAQAYPGAVSGLVLRGLFLASDDEVAWFVTGMNRFLPEAWSAFAADVDDQSCGGLLRHYHARVAMNDVAAAGRWNAWESSVMAVGEAPAASPGADTDAALGRVRIQLHYLIHGCFLVPGQLLRELERLNRLPAILVQGRRDLVCPPGTAYTVARRWPGAQLRMVEEGGHSSMHPAMAHALVQATQDMQRLVAPK